MRMHRAAVPRPGAVGAVAAARGRRHVEAVGGARPPVHRALVPGGGSALEGQQGVHPRAVPRRPDPHRAACPTTCRRSSVRSARRPRAVEKMLRRIGFDYAEQIDPFDGGPHFIAKHRRHHDRARRARGRGPRGRRPMASARGRSSRVETPGARPQFRAIGARVTPLEQRRRRHHRRRAPAARHRGRPEGMAELRLMRACVARDRRGAAVCRASEAGPGSGLDAAARLAGAAAARGSPRRDCCEGRAASPSTAARRGASPRAAATAAWVALRGASGRREALADALVRAAVVRAALERRSRCATSSKPAPDAKTGVLSFAFERAPYRGTLRAQLERDGHSRRARVLLEPARAGRVRGGVHRRCSGACE